MVEINPGYALGQLERALIASAHADPLVRERATIRIAQWTRVIEGMASGALTIGSRTPTSAPAWATLEVVHGGFATGGLAAGGAFLPHETELAARLETPVGDRRALALYYVSDAGRAELADLLATGRYHLEQPEEGALLAITALLAHGATALAMEVLDAITPYFDRLRFHPAPSARAFEASATVHLKTIGEVRADLSTLDTPLAVRRMNESLTVWAPLLDRAVDLATEAAVQRSLHDSISDTWRARAQAFLADHAAARAAHPLCKKPHRPKENLAILVVALRAVVAGETLSPRQQGLVRVAIDGHVGKHGAAGSPERRAHRAAQARVAALPTRSDSASALVGRLAPFPGDGTLETLDGVSGPLTDGPHAGAPLWPSVVAKLERCLEATVADLVAREVLTSGEAIARVLPQISAHVRALGYTDPALARLHAAIDAAFRRRRSLLLLDYASQVKLEELPWLAAITRLRDDADPSSREGARRLFAHVAELGIDAFPHALVPNPLLEELRALAERAEIELPIVDELAADIFMGSFTAKFVRAAEVSARRLEGTLYAQYYRLPIDEVRAIAATLGAPRSRAARVKAAIAGALGGGGQPKPVPAFGLLCERMAALEPGLGRSVARNGRVIEQQQILTTQNLVPLIDATGMGTERFPSLAWRSFEWLVARVQRKAPRHIDRLRSAKNAAYAWRQCIAYLSLGPRAEIPTFLARAEQHLATQPEGFRARFLPFVRGLASAHEGRRAEAVLLGWSTGPHPLLEERADAPRHAK